ncbi:MAG: hypothetical protein MUC69_05840 [Gemmatimonadales bacterium]|nr:hypothetical protein [Gemmatimonadales bacterium]
MKRFPAYLLSLGLVLTALMTTVAYFSRSLLDADAFAARAATAMERPAVSTYVARQIADGVIATHRDLTAIRPLLATLAESIVRSEAFAAVVQRAAREAHGALVSDSSEAVWLALPDVGVMLRGALGAANPTLAERVPATLRAAIATRTTGSISGRVLQAIRLAHRTRQLARWSLVGSLLLVAAGIATARHRRQALLDTGIGLLGVAACLALLPALGEAVLVGAVRDATLRPVAADVWRVFADGLAPWAIGVAAAGLMLLAGTTALLGAEPLRRLLGGGLREFGARQPTRSRELLRIALAFTAGGFAVATPREALVVAVVALGLLLLAGAVHRLVALLSGGDGATPDAHTLRLNPALTIAAAAVMLVVSALGVVAALLRTRPGPVAVAAAPLATCNGSAALCDRRLDEVVLAGAHNAMGTSDDATWMFPNQDGSIAALLERGVRAFLLDVMHGHTVGSDVTTDFDTEGQRAKYEQVVGPEAFAAAMRARDRLAGEAGPVGLYMCHGFCELGAVPFDSALATFARFLATHPSDIVVVVIEDYVPAEEITAAITRAGLAPLVYRGPWRTPLPTLDTLIARRERLVVLGEHATDTAGWYHPAFRVLQETPYTFRTPEAFSCRPNRGARDNPLLLMNHWIETTPAPRPSNAALVNTEAMLVARARECRRMRGKLPNIIAVDFAATGDVVRAAATLNGGGRP